MRYVLRVDFDLHHSTWYRSIQRSASNSFNFVPLARTHAEVTCKAFWFTATPPTESGEELEDYAFYPHLPCYPWVDFRGLTGHHLPEGFGYQRRRTVYLSRYAFSTRHSLELSRYDLSLYMGLHSSKYSTTEGKSFKRRIAACTFDVLGIIRTGDDPYVVV